MSIVRAGKKRWHGNQRHVPPHLNRTGRKPKSRAPQTLRDAVASQVEDRREAAGGVKFPDPDYILRKGKYVGTMIKDLPASYLKWLAKENGAAWAVEELVRRSCQ